ncbi:MAG TPA: LysM domain-containing protein [Phycisphaerae bacterium]|nr:LysM domain-containing protein [Phycisphaerae bacterium]
MRHVMLIAVLAALIAGCKPQDSPAPSPEPIPAPRALEPITPDDELARSSPPADEATRAGADARTLEPPATDEPRLPAAATRQYVVRKGDTFIGIARRELRSESRYREIVKLNPGVQPRKLRIGQAVLIPAE